ncbi:MAG: GTP-binding protein, partial [Myxococcota bacterium]
MPCKPLAKAGSAKSTRVFALACLSVAAPAYAQEAGLEGREDVLLQSDFERADWYEDWGYANLPGPERQNHLELTNDDCFDGEQCLRVHLPRGDHYGASFEYAFRDHGGEPLEMYYRYAVRFGPTWNADLGVDGEILKGCGIENCREDDVVELSNGCICCTVAEDFIPTMQKLIE